MATNTLIQKLFGADESGVGEDSAAVSNRVQHETFRAGETITAGALVSLDFSQSTNGERCLVVKEADAADCVPIGIYDGSADAASGDFIKVCIRGIVEEALTDGDPTNIAIGDLLTISVDGKLVKCAAHEDPPCAVAMEAQAADSTSRVFVLKNY